MKALPYRTDMIGRDVSTNTGHLLRAGTDHALCNRRFRLFLTQPGGGDNGIHCTRCARALGQDGPIWDAERVAQLLGAPDG
jgi:hypothetical protein